MGRDDAVFRTVRTYTLNDMHRAAFLANTGSTYTKNDMHYAAFLTNTGVFSDVLQLPKQIPLLHSDTKISAGMPHSWNTCDGNVSKCPVHERVHTENLSKFRTVHYA